MQISSPYSRFGLGDLSTENNPWNLSLGSLTYSLRSPVHINPSNPASLTAIDSLSFIFEGGLTGTFVQLRTTDMSENANYASLGYLQAGFPVTKWWKTGLGILPFTDIGYNVATSDTMPDVGTITRLYSGAGGINRLFWSNGFRILKNLSVGFNTSLYFGNISAERVVLFPDSAYMLNFRDRSDISITDIYLNYGIQYSIPINKGLTMHTGVAFGTTSRLHAHNERLAHTFSLGATGIEYFKDTVLYDPGIKGRVMIPAYIGGGVSFEKKEKWLAGLDFRWQNWKKFTAFGLSDSLRNGWQASAGIQLIPNINSITSYLKRMEYRFGFRYQDTYLELRGNRIREAAVSLGFGLPLKGMKTYLHLGAEAGIRGTMKDNLIRETFIRFSLGVSINERWFVKRKYY
ncbi:MAG: hypothetical protein FJY10_12000 [Bacteroidetes bacterium]|nr:hypothetical protein [Bacteroidota bacterium]